jgi:hypothetical protein
MSPDPSHTSFAGAAERRPAVWPWLLLPLVALTLFFALRTVKPAPSHHAVHTDETMESAQSEVAESP